jgi:hypothetical protein
MSPIQMWHHLVIWFGNTAFQAAVLYGALLLIAVFTFLHNAEFTKRWMYLGWLLFLSDTIFAFVTRLSYTSHVLNLIPIIYGSTALGIKQLQDYIELRLKHKILRSILQILVLTLPIIQILVLWIALGDHSLNSIIITLTGH